MMAHLKRSIIEVKAENKYVAHALITISRVTNDPKYNSLWMENKLLCSVVPRQDRHRAG
jgi:hypothetical protein